MWLSVSAALGLTARTDFAADRKLAQNTVQPQTLSRVFLVTLNKPTDYRHIYRYIDIIILKLLELL